MISIRCGIALVAAGMLAAAQPARASEQLYTYAVQHPVYGRIGNLVYDIETAAGARRITSQLRVAISIMGVTVYRYETDGIEVWQGSRLMTLQSKINKNGNRIDLRGEAHGGQFIVTSNAGTVATSPDVAPPDPWLVTSVGDSNVISTSTGQVLRVQVSGGESVTIPIHGAKIATRHFSISDDKHHEVWLDGHDIPIMFRSIELGDPVDFILEMPEASGFQTAIPVAQRPGPDRSDR